MRAQVTRVMLVIATLTLGVALNPVSGSATPGSSVIVTPAVWGPTPVYVPEGDYVPSPGGAPVSPTTTDMVATNDASPLPSLLSQPTTPVAMPQGSNGPSSGSLLRRSFIGMQRITTPEIGRGAPPDTNIAVSSNGRLIEVVNRRIQLLTESGTPLATSDLNSFFGAMNADGSAPVSISDWLFDPKVAFDQAAGRPRMYVVALQGALGVTAPYSRIWLAVSRGPNPRSLEPTAWCRYYIDARDAAAPGTWVDYPSIGFGRNSVVISGNNFTFDTASFVSGGVWALATDQLTRNENSCPQAPAPAVWTTVTTANGVEPMPATPVPIQHVTHPSSSQWVRDPVYLAAQSAFNADPALRMMRISGISTSHPVLVGPIPATGTYPTIATPSAPNGAGSLIDTGGIRVRHATGRGSLLGVVHSTGCQFTANTDIESCLRALGIRVTITRNGDLAARVERESVAGGGDGWFYSYPTIAITRDNALVIGHTAVDPRGRLGFAWATIPSGSSTIRNSGWVRQGICSLDTAFQPSRGSNRAGDYTGSSISPDGRSVWIAGERATDIPGIGCAWQTVIGQVRVSS